jgi:hypothetical protein
MSFLLPSSASAAWKYTRTITIHPSQVPNDVTDFPFVFFGSSYGYLTSTGGKITDLTNQYDVGFFTDGTCTTRLDWERVVNSASTHQVAYWMRIPHLSSSSETAINVCYGNPSQTTDASNKNGVWDSHYKTVQHLNVQQGILNLADSTSNGNDMTAGVNITNDGTGLFSGAGIFLNGGGSYIVTNSNFLLGTTEVTMEAWVNSPDFSQQMMVVEKEPVNQDYEMFFQGPGPSLRGASSATATMSVGLTNNQWHHFVTSIFNDNTGIIGTCPCASMVIDGVEQFALGGLVSGVADSANQLNFGRYAGFGGGFYFVGEMFDVHVSNNHRPSSYITTKYNNINSPTAFYTVGSETLVGGIKPSVGAFIF